MVILREEKVIIPTYEISEYDKNPMFLEKRVYQGSSGRVYPHPVCEGVSDTKTDKEYHIGDLYVNPAKHIVKVLGEEISLSFKEYSLLLVLLESNGNVVTREDLLNRVWGEYYDESRTLDVHIRKLRVKLGMVGDFIQTVKNVGYKIGGNIDVQ